MKKRRITQRLLLRLSGTKNFYQPVFGFKFAPTENYDRVLKTIIKCAGRKVKDKTFLDVGCWFGYYCFKLTDMGAKTIGVDVDANKIKACKLIALHHGLPPTNPLFVKSTIEDYVDAHPDEQYDYVLLFHVFHYILANDEKRGWEIFNSLAERSKAILVMMATGTGSGWKLKPAQNVPQSVLANSQLKHYRQFERQRGRYLYAFW